MALETNVILKAVLYQLKMAHDLEAAINAVETMCEQELIAVVNEQVQKEKARIATDATRNN